MNGNPSASSLGVASRAVRRLSTDAPHPDAEDDRVAVEEPLEIRAGGCPLAVTMRTPGHDRDLAAGFCLTEGLVAHPDVIERVEPCAEAATGNVVDVVLESETPAPDAASRALYLSSSCGICGKRSIDEIEQVLPAPLRGAFALHRETIARLPETLREAQSTFEQTGGLHAAGLFAPSGELLVIREDVGRHNAVDKTIGRAALTGDWPIDPAVMLVSGRLSFEIVQKAAMAGIAFVAAVSAPSSLAVDFAERTGMTLVGFLRPGRMNVYASFGRVRSEAE